jgi:hypothetical protein
LGGGGRKGWMTLCGEEECGIYIYIYIYIAAIHRNAKIGRKSLNFNG